MSLPAHRVLTLLNDGVPSGGDPRIHRMPPHTARWTCKPYGTDEAEAVARALGVSRATATVLVRRGFDTPDAARRFLASVRVL